MNRRDALVLSNEQCNEKSNKQQNEYMCRVVNVVMSRVIALAMSRALSDTALYWQYSLIGDIQLYGDIV